MAITSDPAAPAESAPTWEKPGPGTWLQDKSHSGRAPGPILRDLLERGLNEGIADGFANFGAPLRGMELRWVRGKFYRRLVPLVGAERDMKPPPPFVLWLVTRLHPVFRRQEKRARESFTTKRWREEIDRWEAEWKPSIVAANEAFAAVDVTELDDEALADHLGAIHQHLRTTVHLHFRLHVSDMGPLGDLMVHLEDWGLHRDDTFRALRAASPATRAPAEELRSVARTLRDSGTDPTAIGSIDSVLDAGGAAALELSSYLERHGWRLTTGYDLEDQCLAELPDVVATSLRAAGREERQGGGDDLDHLAALRQEVPEQHRATFDELVHDARLSYGLRDENGPLTYEWPAGLLRRGLLEAGRRLAGVGRLADAADVFELTMDEVTALLAGAGSPDLATIAERADERRWWASLDAPPQLGPDEEPPPLSVMPPNLARMTRIVTTVVGSLEADAGTGTPLEGMGIGTEPYTGTARVVHDAGEALAAAEPGDVIVAPYTAPTYNAVLSIAGAIVTEEGGPLCHAAVIARELGLPAVIGAAEAMTRIPDGATVEVDPTAGCVRILSG